MPDAPSGPKHAGLHGWLPGAAFPTLAGTFLETGSQFSVAASHTVTPRGTGGLRDAFLTPGLCRGARGAVPVK